MILAPPTIPWSTNIHLHPPLIVFQPPNSIDQPPFPHISSPQTFLRLLHTPEIKPPNFPASPSHPGNPASKPACSSPTPDLQPVPASHQSEAPVLPLRGRPQVQAPLLEGPVKLCCLVGRKCMTTLGGLSSFLSFLVSNFVHPAYHLILLGFSSFCSCSYNSMEWIIY